MDINVNGRKVVVSDRFRRHLDEKLAKIPNLAPRVSRTEVMLSQEGPSHVVELTCHDRRTVIRAEASADDQYAALDLALGRLTERLRRHVERRKSARSGGRAPESVAAATAPLADRLLVDETAAPSPLDGPLGAAEPVAPAGAESPGASGRRVDAGVSDDEQIDAELGVDGSSPVQVRRKVHESSPMGLSDALNHMELVGHDFFLFVDKDSGRPSVVYRRRGWSYGVIHLDVVPAESDADGSGPVRVDPAPSGVATTGDAASSARAAS